jgi:hypothetical protein
MELFSIFLVGSHSGMEARSRWPSIVNEKTIADCKRVAGHTGILTRSRIIRDRSVDVPAHHPYSATPSGWR